VYVAELHLPEYQPGSPEWNSCLKEIEDNFQQVVDRVEGYAKLATTQQQRDVIAQHVTARNQWKAELDRYINLLQQGTPEARQQAEVLRHQMDPLFESVREPLNTLTETSLKMAENTKKETISLYSGSRSVALIITLVGMGILLFLTIILMMRISRPLSLAVEYLGVIASGDFTKQVPEQFLRMKERLECSPGRSTRCRPALSRCWQDSRPTPKPWPAMPKP
jgi:methyl-accepting chemotaxis protein